MNDYMTLREKLYGEIRSEGIFTWDYMFGEEYALASVYRVPAQLIGELETATERLGAIFQKTVEIIRQSDDELLLGLGVPKAALAAVRVSVLEEWATAIGRFDFAYTDDGVKMLEFNSDTPTGIVEAYYVNAKICGHFGLPNPNDGKEAHIREAFRRMEEAYREKGFATEHIYFSALDWHEEDAATARYLLKQSGLNGSFVPLSDLRVYGDRMYAWTGQEYKPVDLLYRLHAIEKLAEETDDDGYPTGAHALDLIASGNLAVINPPSAFLAQTKAVQALIWNLHEAGQFYTEAEHNDIARYMLPTYMENRFAGEGIPYVSKPILGREGGGVSLFDASGELAAKDHDDFYWEQAMVYQQRVELPKIRVETVSGLYEGYLLWGSFLIGGQASAVLARVGERITGNLSCYVPVALL
jgi:glutathionylspermidine synthase